MLNAKYDTTKTGNLGNPTPTTIKFILGELSDFKGSEGYDQLNDFVISYLSKSPKKYVTLGDDANISKIFEVSEALESYTFPVYFEDDNGEYETETKFPIFKDVGLNQLDDGKVGITATFTDDFIKYFINKFVYEKQGFTDSAADQDIFAKYETL